jgi:spore germination cell wall hydrolase CwlJ-like protein
MAARRAAVLCASAFFVQFLILGEAIPRTSDVDPEETCLAEAIYFEARSEPKKGQLAVGRVVQNRAESGDYPVTICGVVYQGSKRKTGCQFSFTCDGVPETIAEKKAWRGAKARAKELMACDETCRRTSDWRGDLWTSTHYHADYVSPRWAKKLKRTGTVGRHIFYASA